MKYEQILDLMQRQESEDNRVLRHHNQPEDSQMCATSKFLDPTYGLSLHVERIDLQSCQKHSINPRTRSIGLRQNVDVLGL